MTVKELKQKLDQYDDELEVLIDTRDEDRDLIAPEEVIEGALWNIVIR